MVINHSTLLLVYAEWNLICHTSKTENTNGFCSSCFICHKNTDSKIRKGTYFHHSKQKLCAETMKLNPSIADQSTSFFSKRTIFRQNWQDPVIFTGQIPRFSSKIPIFPSKIHSFYCFHLRFSRFSLAENRKLPGSVALWCQMMRTPSRMERICSPKKLDECCFM